MPGGSQHVIGPITNHDHTGGFDLLHPHNVFYQQALVVKLAFQVCPVHPLEQVA